MHLGLFLQRALWLHTLLQEMGKVLSARHSVYWNSTNPRFLAGDYTVKVSINDYLDIFCPHYLRETPPEQTESFQLYMVDAEGYGGCSTKSKAFKRWECNHPYAPYAPVRFSEKIQLFTPFTLGFEFQPGADYYYISMPSPKDEKCLRLRVLVCCTTNASKSKDTGGASQLYPGLLLCLLSLLCSSCLSWL
ncbi:ephrin-A4-like isoform X2 [Pristis pectinata]|uniref:ephrin-A4-like isoform X2 n=1 Tax=Pristis pectinata TaxID=685728 RepID=UPI00223DC768|nr:ephrin-A4-like isoform X2 [Pristis pectinata]